MGSLDAEETPAEAPDPAPKNRRRSIRSKERRQSKLELSTLQQDTLSIEALRRNVADLAFTRLDANGDGFLDYSESCDLFDDLDGTHYLQLCKLVGADRQFGLSKQHVTDLLDSFNQADLNLFHDELLERVPPPQKSSKAPLLSHWNQWSPPAT